MKNCIGRIVSWHRLIIPTLAVTKINFKESKKPMSGCWSHDGGPSANDAKPVLKHTHIPSLFRRLISATIKLGRMGLQQRCRRNHRRSEVLSDRHIELIANRNAGFSPTH